MIDEFGEKGYRSEEVLRDLYYDRRNSVQEIADGFGVSRRAIHNWMEKHDIDRRSLSESISLAQQKQPAAFFLTEEGYERWSARSSGRRWSVRVHRLLAVAEYGFDEVGGKVVHHQNGIPWDNRPDNIELMDNSEHARMHALEQTRP